MFIFDHPSIPGTTCKSLYSDSIKALEAFDFSQSQRIHNTQFPCPKLATSKKLSQRNSFRAKVASNGRVDILRYPYYVTAECFHLILIHVIYFVLLTRWSNESYFLFVRVSVLWLQV